MGGWEKPEDAMPFVGLYVSGASLLCTLAMAADALQGFRQRRLWFPCRWFTIDAVSITLIAISTKLPVDLTTKMPTAADFQSKYISVFFLVIMVTNFLPSSGLMGDKDLLTNIIAFGILVVTLTVNVFIQSFTASVYIDAVGYLLFIVTILLPLSVSLLVPTSRRILERRYKELHNDSSCEKIKSSYKELISHVKKYWIMAETGNPQFVIASSSVSYAFGATCLVLDVFSIYLFFSMYPYFSYRHAYASSDYLWSIHVITTVQTLGIVLGSVAPIFRCLTAVSHFEISGAWTMNHLNVFKVDNHWTQMLWLWKLPYVPSHIPGRQSKKVFLTFRNMILNFCIALQITLVVIYNIISLVPRSILILLRCCWRYMRKCLQKSCKQEQNAPDSHVESEIDPYSKFVLHFEEESHLSKKVLKNTLNSIDKLIQKSEKKEPSNLVKLLKKSTGPNGLLEFDNNQDPYQNSWSLVLVTLTAIAIALPNIEKKDVEVLLSSMREGLQFVGNIEEKLNADSDELVNARKTTRRVWTEVEVYNKWLKIDLRKIARSKETSKVTLKCLVEEAEKYKSRKNDSLDHVEHKFIAASSMCRISKMILRRYEELENWPEDKDLFDRISTLNADILCACFTNLPRVIRMMCHHKAIEKREDGIRAAAQLLGKSKKIVEILEHHQPLPHMDPDSMAYIDKWHALPQV